MALGNWRLSRDRKRTLAIAALTGLLALVLAAAVLRVWWGDLSVPFSYESDANDVAAVVKGIVDHGWYQENPDVAAPFGQERFDFPISDNNLQLVGLKFLSIFARDYAVVLNLFFLLGFPLVAISALFVLRRLGVSTPVSVAIAILFAMLPYHFTRGEVHLYLSFYVTIPLVVYSAVLAFYGGEPPNFITPVSRLGLILLAVLIGSSSAYYAAFGILLVVVATALGYASRRKVGALGVGALFVVGVIVALAVNLAPNLAYRIRHGENVEVARRPAGDSETYALKITSLLLPVEGHRFGPAARLRQRYQDDFPVPSEEQALGAAASVGFVWLVGVALVSTAGLARHPPLERHRPLAALALASTVIATLGGLSSLISLLVSPQLRAWNRFSVVLAFLALTALAYLLDSAGRRLRAHRWPPAAVGLALVGFLMVALWDQTTGRYIPEYRKLTAEFDSDRDYVKGVEQLVPPGGMVFQLPYVPFPGAGPLHEMIDYDHYRPYLQSRHTRWSYGAMRGRATDWAASLVELTTADTVTAVASVGFNGISVDRSGYADGAKAIEDGLARQLGAPATVSPNGRLAYFDLSGFRQSLEARVSRATLDSLHDTVLRPLRVRWGDGFLPQRSGEGRTWRWANHAATLVVTNPDSMPRSLLLEFDAETHTTGPWTLTLSHPGGSEALRLSGDSRRFSKLLTLPPGASELQLTTDAPARVPPGEDLPLAFRIIDPSFTDPQLNHLLATASPA